MVRELNEIIASLPEDQQERIEKRSKELAIEISNERPNMYEIIMNWFKNKSFEPTEEELEAQHRESVGEFLRVKGYRSEEDEEWLNSPPVGKELI